MTRLQRAGYGIAGCFCVCWYGTAILVGIYLLVTNAAEVWRRVTA